MELSLRSYQTLKIKTYLKKNFLNFFLNKVNSKQWILTEQNFKTINFNYYRVLNRATKKLIKTSIFINIISLIKGIVVFVKPKSLITLKKQIVLKLFDFFNLVLFAIKFNNKIYSIKKIKNLNTFKYKENKITLFQFKLTNLKLYLINYRNNVI